jgi:hypothetical protein
MHFIQVLTTLCFLCQLASSQGNMSRYWKNNSCYRNFFMLLIVRSKPLKSEWVKGPEPKDKEGLLDWLLGMEESAPIERPAVDGFYNNLFMPEQGAFGTQLNSTLLLIMFH